MCLKIKYKTNSMTKLKIIKNLEKIFNRILKYGNYRC